jgi:hypothetical protein
MKRMKSLVYLETSVVSYLAARPSRDLIVAAHQQITQQWWDQRENWGLYAWWLPRRPVAMPMLQREESSFCTGLLTSPLRRMSRRWWSTHEGGCFASHCARRRIPYWFGDSAWHGFSGDMELHAYCQCGET